MWLKDAGIKYLDIDKSGLWHHGDSYDGLSDETEFITNKGWTSFSDFLIKYNLEYSTISMIYLDESGNIKCQKFQNPKHFKLYNNLLSSYYQLIRAK